MAGRKTDDLARLKAEKARLERAIAEREKEAARRKEIAELERRLQALKGGRGTTRKGEAKR